MRFEVHGSWWRFFDPTWHGSLSNTCQYDWYLNGVIFVERFFFVLKGLYFDFPFSTSMIVSTTVLHIVWYLLVPLVQVVVARLEFSFDVLVFQRFYYIISKDYSRWSSCAIWRCFYILGLRKKKLEKIYNGMCYSKFFGKRNPTN